MKQIYIFAALILGVASCDTGAQELASDSQLPVAPVLTPVEPDPNESASRVKTAILETAGMAAHEISVATHAGTVVLSGKVNTEAERVAVIATAEKAAHGIRVSSSIELRPSDERPVKDQQAALQSVQFVREVEAALKADARTANLGITVTATDPGVILLQGLVPTAASRAAAQAVALQVKGVSRVDNRLQLPGG